MIFTVTILLQNEDEGYDQFIISLAIVVTIVLPFVNSA